MKRPLTQAIILIVAASALAIIANGFAGPQRRLLLPGIYPDALRVPPRVSPPPAPMPAAPAPAAVAAPAPVVAPPTPSTATATTPLPTPASPTPTPAPATPAAPIPAPDPLARFTPHSDKPYVEIAGDDAALLHARGALFLDARRTSVFEEGHIAGARSFSVWEADADDKVTALYNERGNDPAEQNKPIVIYCSGGACEDSHMLAQKLWGVQFNNVYVYKDGFPDWQKRGGATRTGGNP